MAFSYKNYFDRTTIGNTTFSDIASFESGLSGATLSEYVQRAMDKFHTVHQEIPRPIPESMDDFSTLDFDIDVDDECKLWYCFYLVSRNPANSELAKEFQDRALRIAAAHSHSGYIDPETKIPDIRYYSWQLPERQAYVPMVRSYVTNNVSMRARGYYECNYDQNWIVKIDTAGDITAATYKISINSGSTYPTTLQSCQNLTDYPSGWLPLGYGGIQIKFNANSTTFTVNDQFEIKIKSKIQEQVKDFGSVRLEWQ